MHTQKTFIDLFFDAGIVVQLIMLLLLLASVWGLAIALNKFRTLGRVSIKTKQFDKMLSPEKMQVLFDAVKGSTPQSPAEHVFVAVMTELPYLRARTKDTHELAQQLEAIFLTTKNEQIMRLERHLNMLATISSSAPFIGLFGTVWGIMTSFQAIAASKTTSLAVVAPGIAESLLATAFGLVAAIPALIFYNILIGKVDRIEQKTSNFWIKLKSCVIAKQ